jgi:microcompartment protein CcmK/EutM
VSSRLYSSKVAASVIGVGSGERLLVTGSSVRGKRDERRWHELYLLLGAGI